MSVQSWLNQPPDQVAGMMAQSISSSTGGSTATGAIPLPQVLTELRAMQPAQKSALLQKAVQGMGTLPPKDQAQLISLGMKMQKKHIQGGQAMSPEQQQVVALAQDAIRDVPPQELQKVTVQAQRTAMQATQDPARMLMVAKELPAADRLELQQTLVENKIVPPEREALLNHALQPNGPLDQLAITAYYLEMAKPYATALLFVPVVEWGFGFLFSLFPCEAPLPEWLCWDGFGMVFTFLGFYLAYMNFEHIKALAVNPPPGLTEAALAQNVDSVMQAIPPENKMTLMIGVGGLVAAAVGVLCQVIWAVWGVLTLLNMTSCNGFVSFVCKIVIAAKSFLVLGIIAYSAYQGKQVWDKSHGGYGPVNQ